MNFLISPAYAQGAAQGDAFGFFLPMIVIFVAFYFLLIRPQQKRQKAHAALVGALSTGDEVLTAGGILGKVTGVSEHYATFCTSRITLRSRYRNRPYRPWCRKALLTPPDRR